MDQTVGGSTFLDTSGVFSGACLLPRFEFSKDRLINDVFFLNQKLLSIELFFLRKWGTF